MAPDHLAMSVAGPGTAVPTPDVLPAGVRRRLALRDAALVGVLALELLVGVGAGVAWDARDALGRVWLPEPVVAAPAGGATGGTATSAMTTRWVVVPPPTAPPAPAPPPLRTEPRSPFEVRAR